MQGNLRLKSKNLSGAKGRLIEYLEYKGISKASFYKTTSLANGFLDKNDNIGSNNIEIIISKYPDINLAWLITGNGEMTADNDSKCVMTTIFFDKILSAVQVTKDEHNKIIEQNGIIIDNNGKIIEQNSEVMRQNSEVLAQNAKVQEQNSELIKQNSEFVKIIAQLSQKIQ